MINHFLISIFFFITTRPTPRSTLFPYTTLFRSLDGSGGRGRAAVDGQAPARPYPELRGVEAIERHARQPVLVGCRSEEHTSELQSRENLVCRLLLEKKKKKRRDQECRASSDSAP